jgi:hypothetical protein
MALFTHTLGVTYKTDAGTIASTTDNYTGDAENDLELSGTAPLIAGAVNSEFDMQITVAKIQSMVLYADQNVVIKTNSTGSPGNTVNLVAKKQVVWNTDSVMAKPFTTDTTKLFLSNSNTVTAATVRIRVLENL